MFIGNSDSAVSRLSTENIAIIALLVSPLFKLLIIFRDINIVSAYLLVWNCNMNIAQYSLELH